jgi:hypothetical protein
MTIGNDQKDVSRNEDLRSQKMQEDAARTRQEIERRIRNIGQCFEAVILPAVRSVENDLNQAGYLHQVTTRQFPDSDTPLVREVIFQFFPDRAVSPENAKKAQDAACKATIAATGDYRKLIFTIQFPRKLPPGVEIVEFTRAVADINTSIVDDFLEKFIKGALNVHLSDRVLL